MIELDIRKEKRKMPSKDEVDFIFKCKTVWTKSMNNTILVITKSPIALDVLFGKYYDVIKLNLSNIIHKTEEQVTLEDLDGQFVEF